MSRRFTQLTHTPIGTVTVIADDEAIAGVYLSDHRHRPDIATDGQEARTDPLLQEATKQLSEYLSGERTAFQLPLHAPGTEFQRTVWAALQEIPYGQTWSYGELAAHIGSPKASRAVGLANGRNPISIVVPCHRVIGASGAITGYGGGVERKEWLLSLERGVAEPALFG